MCFKCYSGNEHSQLNIKNWQIYCQYQPILINNADSDILLCSPKLYSNSYNVKHYLCKSVKHPYDQFTQNAFFQSTLPLSPCISI